METQSRNTSDQQHHLKRRPVIKASLGFVFGAILGLIIGNAVGSQALGLIFGAGIGLIVGSALDHRSK
ncbi:MAG TPA: glycine zipper domain-containing protein [Anaerolineales bacterium]|nr:glycine zipper domain-containing protein [Anaerolineales bacterium]